MLHIYLFTGMFQVIKWIYKPLFSMMDPQVKVSNPSSQDASPEVSLGVREGHFLSCVHQWELVFLLQTPPHCQELF